MLNFDKRLLGMIENIKFLKVKCEFQKKLSADIRNNIVKSDKLLVPADKTSSFYRMDATSYNDLRQKNITMTYKNVTQGTTSCIELEAKAIAKKMHLDDRINTNANLEAFITLKDHKPNFANNPTSTAIVNHGVRKPHQIFLKLLWGATTVLNLVSWLVLISSTKSKRSLAARFCDFDLYRDNGLRIYKASPRQTELIKKYLFSIFSNYGLKIIIEADKKSCFPQDLQPISN